MANKRSNKRTRSPFTKRGTNKQPDRAFSITEMMQFSKRELRLRAGLKRGPINAPEVAPKAGGLTAEQLIRWKKSEKPIEIIG